MDSNDNINRIRDIRTRNNQRHKISNGREKLKKKKIN